MQDKASGPNACRICGRGTHYRLCGWCSWEKGGY